MQKKDHAIFLSIMAVSWFYFIGAAYLTQVPNFTKIVLNSLRNNNHAFTHYLFDRNRNRLSPVRKDVRQKDRAGPCAPGCNRPERFWHRFIFCLSSICGGIYYEYPSIYKHIRKHSDHNRSFIYWYFRRILYYPFECIYSGPCTKRVQGKDNRRKQYTKCTSDGCFSSTGSTADRPF